jgi:predicted Na+-dependent transporter
MRQESIRIRISGVAVALFVLFAAAGLGLAAILDRPAMLLAGLVIAGTFCSR